MALQVVFEGFEAILSGLELQMFDVKGFLCLGPFPGKCLVLPTSFPNRVERSPWSLKLGGDLDGRGPLWTSC